MGLESSIQGAGAGAAIGSAVAPGVGTVVGGVIGFFAPIIGDLIGGALASGDKEKAQRILEQAVAQYGPDMLRAPGIRELTPHLDTSAMAVAMADPESQAAQRSALARLGRYGQPGADDLEFRASMDAATRGANQQAASQNALLRNEMQARGRGNTGAEYAARALANQQAAERGSAGAFQAGAEQSRRALQALQGYGNLATTMRGQSFDEAAQRARAADELARSNELWRVGGQQQAFANQMGINQARTGAMGNLANAYAGKAADTQNQFANYGQAAGQVAGVVGNYLDDPSRQPRYPGGR